MIKIKHYKIFIDTSVLIAATLSNSGASKMIFRLANKKYLTIMLTEKVVQEANKIMRKKYGQIEISDLINLLSDFKKSILLSPSKNEENQFKDIILDQNDTHILAGAKKYQADIILTLDKKHFFSNKILKAKLPYTIKLPGDFLKELRKNS